MRHQRATARARRSGGRSAPLVAALAVAAVGLLAACGGGDQDPPAAGGTSKAAGDGGVASIVGSAGPGGSPSPQAERPLIRPDTSREEEDRLYSIYLQCVSDNGGAKFPVPVSGGDAPPMPGVRRPRKMKPQYGRPPRSVPHWSPRRPGNGPCGSTRRTGTSCRSG
jgi:hypothetical protein